MTAAVCARRGQPMPTGIRPKTLLDVLAAGTFPGTSGVGRVSLSSENVRLTVQ